MRMHMRSWLQKREKINRKLSEQEERAKEFERSKQESLQARVEMQRVSAFFALTMTRC